MYATSGVAAIARTSRVIVDVIEGAEMLAASEDIGVMSTIVSLMSAEDLERGLELARLAGELWTIGDVMDAVDMPILSAFMADRSE